MGEGILIYGLNNDRRKYTRDLQTFADKVLKIGRPKGLLYKFGNISRYYGDDQIFYLQFVSFAEKS